MIRAEIGKERTTVELEGQLGDLMNESISIVESIRLQIVDHLGNSEQVIFQYVNALIDAGWGKK